MSYGPVLALIFAFGTRFNAKNPTFRPEVFRYTKMDSIVSSWNFTVLKAMYP